MSNFIKVFQPGGLYKYLNIGLIQEFHPIYSDGTHTFEYCPVGGSLKYFEFTDFKGEKYMCGDVAELTKLGLEVIENHAFGLELDLPDEKEPLGFKY